jgi:hypothetical protein
VWDLNKGVSIPVMFVTAATLTFYIWSSIAASIIDDFPYTTVISRLVVHCKWILKSYLQQLQWPFSRIRSTPIFMLSSLAHLFYLDRLVKLVSIGTSLISCLVLASVRSRWCMFNCQCVPEVAPVWNCMINWSHRGRHILSGIVASTVGLLREYHQRLGSTLDAFGDSWRERLSTFKHQDTARINSPKVPSLSYSDGASAESIQSPLVSFALQWLITSSEEPMVVDTALQAVAGANQRFYREPLNHCNAASMIAHRLVSGSLYRNMDRADISLYTRALYFLGTSESGTQYKGRMAGEVVARIWDFQSRNDRYVTESWTKSSLGFRYSPLY